MSPTGRLFSPRTSVSSSNKTDRHDINTINLIPHESKIQTYTHNWMITNRCFEEHSPNLELDNNLFIPCEAKVVICKILVILRRVDYLNTSF